MMRKYFAEFIGTFFLVFTVGMTAVNPNGCDPMVAPLAIGSVLMVMIYAGGHISGGHFNPAVTFAVWVRGKIGLVDAILYMISQALAGLVAAVAAYYYLMKQPLIEPLRIEVLPVLLVEFLFTFALAYVVLNTATSKDTAGNSNYGLAIGFTVLVGAYAVGGISGGVFNPAVAGGLALMVKLPARALWLYLLANFSGGFVAGFLFKVFNPDDE